MISILIFYALETIAPVFLLAFAVACLASSLDGFLRLLASNDFELAIAVAVGVFRGAVGPGAGRGRRSTHRGTGPAVPGLRGAPAQEGAGLAAIYRRAAHPAGGGRVISPAAASGVLRDEVDARLVASGES